MLVRSTFAVACVVAALTCARVNADCSDPEAFGVPYNVETSVPGLAPHLEDDELVMRVSGRGLALADACEVLATDQFTLHWMKEADMAIVKLKRDVPESCLESNDAEETEISHSETVVSPEEAVEIRLALPFELRRGAQDFSRMLLGLPPGGIYEAYKIFDHSALTRSADAFAQDPEDFLETEEFADAEEDSGHVELGVGTGDDSETTLRSVPRKAAAEKDATE
jgi:hypothetical protein